MDKGPEHAVYQKGANNLEMYIEQGANFFSHWQRLKILVVHSIGEGVKEQAFLYAFGGSFNWYNLFRGQFGNIHQNTKWISF